MHHSSLGVVTVAISLRCSLFSCHYMQLVLCPTSRKFCVAASFIHPCFVLSSLGVVTVAISLGGLFNGGVRSISFTFNGMLLLRFTTESCTHLDGPHTMQIALAACVAACFAACTQANLLYFELAAEMTFPTPEVTSGQRSFALFDVGDFVA